MNKLYNAMHSNDKRTENGMVTHSTSGSRVLDLFYKMGASRNMSEVEIENMFASAYAEDKNLALKAMFYNGDIRGGQMERRSFQTMFRWLCFNDPQVARRLIAFVPFFNRWDSVFLTAMDSPVEKQMLALITENVGKDALANKWMPREHKRYHKFAVALANKLGLSMREYRKWLAEGNNVVETAMCENRWEDIVFDYIPSVAAHKYMKAMWKHQAERYGEWIEAVKTGKVSEKTGKVAKVNAGAIFPHDIVKPYLRYGARKNDAIEIQWDALPDFITSGESFIVVDDGSGSMYSISSMIAPDLYAGDVAVALSIYLAERNKSVFKNGVITFSERPVLFTFGENDSLYDKVRTVKSHNEVANTNFEAVFTLILRKAQEAGLSQEDMPDNILVLSDMQFDQCVTHGDESAMRMIRRMYDKAGYVVPNIVFWNLSAKNGVPAKMNEQGTALVSGFSPSIMGSIFGGQFTPEAIMMKSLMAERYEQIHI